MDAMKVVLWSGAAAAGAVGWSGRFEYLPVALGVLVCWRFSRSASEALGVACAYYGAASLGLVEAASTFFGSASAGVLTCAGASLLVATPWATLWSPGLAASARSRVARGGGLGVLLLVPPFGFISWANPWVAGVAVMPGLGYAGLVLVTLSLLAPNAKTWPGWAAVFLGTAALACGRYEPVKSAKWTGVSTQYGALIGRTPAKEYDMVADAWSRAAMIDADVVLFPEGVGGAWIGSSASLWGLEAEQSQKVMVVGAIESEGKRRRNGVGVVGQGKPRFWAQRLPAPIGMWAPWRPLHVESNVFASSIEVIRGRRAALLLCFEQFVSWPAFQSAIEGAEIVLAPANLWFGRGTKLDAMRKITVQSWGALMGWQVVEAING